VASRLLPRAARADLLAFYGFARFIDELGDTYSGDRPAALRWAQAETRRALEGTARSTHPLIGPAADAVGRLAADPQPLFDLIAANQQDQVTTRYLTFGELLDYCRLSANPVGRLVLAAFGVTEPAALAYSDAVCSGLQLTEHWQDVAEDARAGRVYLPGGDLDRFDVDPADLVGPGPADPALRGLMSFEVSRARRLLDEGGPLIGLLSGQARWATAGFLAGGRAALDAIASRHYDPLRGPARPAKRRIAVHLLAAYRGAGR
jgi:squalene synthase HpnC